MEASQSWDQTWTCFSAAAWCYANCPDSSSSYPPAGCISTLSSSPFVVVVVVVVVVVSSSSSSSCSSLLSSLLVGFCIIGKDNIVNETRFASTKLCPPVYALLWTHTQIDVQWFVMIKPTVIQWSMSSWWARFHICLVQIFNLPLFLLDQKSQWYLAISLVLDTSSYFSHVLFALNS